VGPGRGATRVVGLYDREKRPAEQGSTVNVHCKNPKPPMSAMGQKRRFGRSVIRNRKARLAGLGNAPSFSPAIGRHIISTLGRVAVEAEPFPVIQQLAIEPDPGRISVLVVLKFSPILMRTIDIPLRAACAAGVLNFWKTLNYNKTTPRFAGWVVSHAARKLFKRKREI